MRLAAIGFAGMAAFGSAWCAELPTARELLAAPQAVRLWANRVVAEDRKVRSEATTALAQGGADSLPLLRWFLTKHDEVLEQETFEIIRRIGPITLPFVMELLGRDEVAIRRQAVSVLIDFAPATAAALPAMVRALNDSDPLVAGDAARALGALGGKASAAVPALVAALSHRDEHVRIYAAEALASIGPEAAAAVPKLAESLRERVAGVRWAAGEALAAIGPPAVAAVPQLVQALTDEALFVRLCAAGALGSIGPAASAAIEPLKAAADDPAMRAESAWALARITGTPAETPAAPTAAVSSSAVSPAVVSANDAGNPPVDWDPKTGSNLIWSVPLGKDTFGRPVVSGGVVFVGTDNGKKLNPACVENCGALMAFQANDGTFLWQDLAPRVKRGMREFLLPSTTSAPCLEGEQLYYVTAECQLRCLDLQGFRDGENDGSFQQEKFRDERSADIIWELDMCGSLGVFPHEASNSEVKVVGDLLLVCTSNGRNEGHTRVPSPRAPSLIAVDKRSGEGVWRAIGPGDQVLHGQWCSPVVAEVNGRTQVLFGGGDGWLRAYDAASGREIWRFDGNPKDAQWLPRPGVFSRSPIVASPLHHDGRVFIAMGQDPSHGNGPSLLHAIDPNGHGDTTASRCLWTNREVGRVVGAPVARDGLLYVGDLGGTVHCLDAATGTTVWRHETDAAIWGCLLLTKERLYVGNVDGLMTVLKTGRRLEVLATIEMNEPLFARPALVGDALYLVTADRLYLIGH